MRWLTGLPLYRTARSFLRARLFGVLRRVLATDDGRRIVYDVLADVFQPRIDLPPYNQLTSLEYEELQGSLPDLPTGKRFVVVTGRFRTGSTLLWNIFRHVPGCTAYYEPFNERRYFDRSRRGSRTDPTHVHVKEQWKEYDGLPCCDELASLYDEQWARRNLYMSSETWAPSMRGFIQAIVDGTERLPVLQFNRVDFRLPWIRATFPNATIVHVYRHPRDQWCSTLQDVTCYPKTRSTQDFAAHDHFYLRSWARDLKYHFPFLDEDCTSHAYELFYYIWRLSYVFGRHYADYSLSFENLVAGPREEIERLMEAVGIEDYDVDCLMRLVATPRLGRWKDYAENEWFRRLEMRCEQALGGFFSQRTSGARDSMDAPEIGCGSSLLGQVE